MPSNFCLVRDCGGWDDVGSEGNDGMTVDSRLWDLRVAYMMGAGQYGNLKRQDTDSERFLGCVDEFLAQFPVVKLAPVEVRSADSYTFKMKTPEKLQTFSRIELPVNVHKAIKGSGFVSIQFADGSSICSDCRGIDIRDGEQSLAFTFTTPAECRSTDEALVALYVFDRIGRLALDKISLNVESADQIKLMLDLREQRSFSLAVISRASASGQPVIKGASK